MMKKKVNSLRFEEINEHHKINTNRILISRNRSRDMLEEEKLTLYADS
jgi:hypothetical protein